MTDPKNWTKTIHIPLIRKKEQFLSTICISQQTFDPDAYQTFFHPEELNQITVHQTAKRRQSLLMGKWVGKTALKESVPDNVALVDFYIKKGIFEHPVLYTPFIHDRQVSISHSADLGAAICFPELHPMGIDIETFAHIKPHVVQIMTTENEFNLFQNITDNEKLSCSFLWTIKEALSKSIKTGLMIDFKYLEITSLEKEGNIYISHFEKFPQYKALTFHTEEWCCSVVLPKRTSMDVNLILEAFK